MQACTTATLCGLLLEVVSKKLVFDDQFLSNTQDGNDMQRKTTRHERKKLSYIFGETYVKRKITCESVDLILHGFQNCKMLSKTLMVLV